MRAARWGRAAVPSRVFAQAAVATKGLPLTPRFLRFRHMSSVKRSLIAFEQYQKGAEKFDYFVLGVSLALCAYVGQTLKPERLGCSPYTLEVFGIALIIASIILLDKLVTHFVFAAPSA